MKSFFKSVLATVVGLILFTIIFGIFSIMSIIGVAASQGTVKTSEPNSIMVLKLSGIIDEKSDQDILGTLTGNQMENLSLNNILAAIEKAKNNDDIQGIYLETGVLGSGYATLQEIRNALEDFKKSGKWIVSYADSYTQGAYYVASVSNEICINPVGVIDWHGLASQPYYIKDLAAKFGVKYQVVKVGTYKSFTETYTEDKMSDANRLQITAFINQSWQNICQDVSKSRKVTVDSLNAYADRLIAMEPATNYHKYKLVDKLVYAADMKDLIRKRLKIGEDEDIKQYSVADMNELQDLKEKSENNIAVYYAQGGIVQSKAAGMFNNDKNIVGEDMCRDLDELKNDDDIKAVVIRVNSGGGDAFASEQIWNAVSELRKKKPVVISMGDYAASGAYYLSCNADWIVAQPNTLTGSIGIFGVIPDFSELLTEKLGVRFDEVKTNRNAGMGTMARPLNTEETHALTMMINRGYQLFRQRVADGRKLPVNEVEKIAQGRVWVGNDALKVKLVDQLGGLNTAIAKAAALAKIKDYETLDYPGSMDWLDQIMNMNNENNYLDAQLRQTLGMYYEPFALFRKLNQRAIIQARIPFEPNIN